MAQVFVRAIVAKQYDITKLTKEITKGLVAESKQIEREFKKTTNTWNDPARFSFRKITGLGKIGIRTFTRNKKMFYLNFGTRVRWALMSDSFQAKTRARVIGSRQGRNGQPILRGLGAMQSRGIGPRPGIQPREFDKEIANRRQPFFVIRMKAHFIKGTRR